MPLLPRHAGTDSHADEGPRVTKGPGDRWALWGPQACGDQGPIGVCGDTHQQSRVSFSSVFWVPPSPGDSHYLGTTIPGNHHPLGTPIPRVALSPCCPHSEQHRVLRAAGPWGPPPSLGAACVPRVRETIPWVQPRQGNLHPLGPSSPGGDPHPRRPLGVPAPPVRPREGGTRGAGGWGAAGLSPPRVPGPSRGAGAGVGGRAALSPGMTGRVVRGGKGGAGSRGCREGGGVARAGRGAPGGDPQRPPQ